MRCRNVKKNSDGIYDISFFNSTGLGEIKNYYTIISTEEKIEINTVRTLPSKDADDINNIYKIVDEYEDKTTYYMFINKTWYTVNSSTPLITINSDSATRNFAKYGFNSTDKDEVLKEFKSKKSELLNAIEDQENLMFARTTDVTPYKSKYATSYLYDSKEAIASNLITKLSIIRGELWYNKTYGLPLLDKIKNKWIMDAEIVDIILSESGVSAITSLDSTLTKEGVYTAEIKVSTIYGDISVSI